jgi:hypothetical protein
MKQWVAWTLAATLSGMTLGVTGCGEGGSSSGDTTKNFRLLVSDEVNAIGDFSELWVTISTIGVHQAGNRETWLRFSPPVPDGENAFAVNLVPLAGKVAQEVWSGTIPPGDYTKAFVYVDAVSGTLAANGQQVALTLPSGKLQISKPFSVENGTTTAFVYDLTVVSTGAGQGGDDYLLKPQLSESGADQEYDEIEVDEDGDLDVVLVGDPFADALVELRVTHIGSPVDGATVLVNDQEVGETNAEGIIELAFDIQDDEVEIEVYFGELEGELEIQADEDDDHDEWFEGTITALTEGTENGSPWTVEIEGEGTVTVYVAELKEGVPAVGARVEIEGQLQDNVIGNAEAEIDDDEDSGDTESGEDD